MYEYLEALIHYDSSFTPSSLDSLVKLYHSTRSRYEQFKILQRINETEINGIVNDMIGFVRGVRSVCTEKWAKFNDAYIYSGICVLILHLVGVWMVYLHTAHSRLSLYTSSMLHDWWPSIDVLWLLSIFLLLFHAFSLFSNSFVVFEQHVVTFSTQSIVVIMAYHRIRHIFKTNPNYSKPNPSSLFQMCLQVLWPYIGVLVCVRLSAIYHTCRDQQDECNVKEFLFPFTKYIATSSSPLGICLRLVVIGISVYFYRLSIRHFEQTLYSNTLTQHTGLYKAMVGSIFFTIGRELVWIVIAIPLIETTSYKHVSVWLAWIGYAPFIIGLCLLILNPWYYYDSQVHDKSNSVIVVDHIYVSVSWLLILVMCPIILVVGVPNDSYILPLGLMITQLSLTIRIIHGPCKGK